MRTFVPDKRGIAEKWYVVDAEGQVLGRLATRIARLLIGKGKPSYTPFLDMGDHVIVVNASIKPNRIREAILRFFITSSLRRKH